MSSSRTETPKRGWEEVESFDTSPDEEVLKRRRSAPPDSDSGSGPSLGLTRSISELPLHVLLNKFPDHLQRSVQRFREVAKRELRRLQAEMRMDPLTAAKTLVQSIRSAPEQSSPPHDEIEHVIAKGAPDEAQGADGISADVAVWAILVKDELQKLRLHGTQTSDAVEILVSRMERLSAQSFGSLPQSSAPNLRKRQPAEDSSSTTSTSISFETPVPSSSSSSSASQPKRSRAIPPDPSSSIVPAPAAPPSSSSDSSSASASSTNTRKRSSNRTENSSHSLNVSSSGGASVEESLHPLETASSPSSHLHLKRAKSVTFVEQNSS